jgi:hypothetical protein
MLIVSDTFTNPFGKVEESRMRYIILVLNFPPWHPFALFTATVTSNQMAEV